MDIIAVEHSNDPYSSLKFLSLYKTIYYVWGFLDLNYVVIQNQSPFKNLYWN